MTASAAVSLPMIENVPSGQEPTRGLGVLELLGPQGRMELPLASVSIAAKVSSFVAEVTVTQTFKNPHREHLEAEYVFPLAGGCAVGHFELRVAGRVVVGKVEERGEAQRQYQQAIAEGKRAALLEQERTNVFTVKVGNLPPGEEATVMLRYSERLAFFEDGAGELRLPLVVAPRYMAGEAVDGPSGSSTHSDTTKVPDASRLSPPLLAPGFDPQTGLQLEVELLHEKGVTSFDNLACSQHATKTVFRPDSITVSLARAERFDRDFVLRWRMGGAGITSTLQVYPTPEGEHFALLSILPPRRDGFLGLPRNVVFVVDRSGSMGGAKMTSAARACALLLRTLGPRDRFAVQAFDDRCEWLGGAPKFVAADEAGLEQGEAFLRQINARGGTELDLAMRKAIGVFAQDEKHEGLPIIVLLTDGQVGDESSVLKGIQTSLGEARVFTVGIDTAVNDGFLQRLAGLGGGTATFVEPGTQLEEALRAVGREIGAPLVTNLSIHDENSGADLASLAPAHFPDLFEGRAASVFLRVRSIGKLTVTGLGSDGKRFSQTVTAQPLALPALAQLWARTRVADLEDRFRLASAGMPVSPGGTPDSLKAEIVALACKHTLLTRFTAFVAIDQEVVNQGGEGRKVVQPVQLPAQWEEQDLSAGIALGAPMFRMAAPGAMAAAASPVSPGLASPGRAVLERIATFITGSGRAKEGRDAQLPRPEPGPSKAELAPVQEALGQLWAALAALDAELKAGRVPEPRALAEARTALLTALTGFIRASQLGAVQTFLRTGVAELLAALQAKAPIAGVQALLVRHAVALANARRQADTLVEGKSAPEAWERSI